MLWIMVIYDISEDRTRTKVYDICKDYGLDRQQYSVFAGRLRARQVRALAKELRHETQGGGHIVIVPLDEDNWDKRIELGAALHG